jgi:phage terminase large subunit GpA-like protein
VPGKDVNMSEVKKIKSYVRPDNTVVISCPHCGRQKSVPVESFKDRKTTIKVKCACTNIFALDIEFRKKIRKRVHLRGTYINHSQKNRHGNLIVQDVSLGGLAFSSIDIHDFKTNDELTIEFQLDDEHRTTITKAAFVKDIRKRTIGCEFERGGEFAYDGPLGFYIMSS